MTNDPRIAAVAEAIRLHVFGEDYPADEAECCAPIILAAADAVDGRDALIAELQERIAQLESDSDN